jgi:hypothetical protein
LTRTSAWAVLLARAPARAAHRLASMVSPQRAHTRLEVLVLWPARRPLGPRKRRGIGYFP